MDKDFSKEVAFFNILNTALNLNISEAASNFQISISELEEKIRIDREEIKKNIKRLENSGLICVKSSGDDSIVLDLSHSYNKLAEVFTKDEIDEILKELDYFIKKYDTLLINNGIISKYMPIIKEKIVSDPNCDINGIIRDGIEEAFDNNTIIGLEKKIYNLCEDANNKDLEIIEVILFCFYNFKSTENPFFVTLFLASIFKSFESENIA